MLKRAGHLDKVKNINIKSNVLDPMKDTYQVWIYLTKFD